MTNERPILALDGLATNDAGGTNVGFLPYDDIAHQ
jgi:hypothetical protein